MPASGYGNILIAIGAAACTTLAIHWWKRHTASKTPLPPSPKSYPLIGNLLSMPTGNQHIGFIEIGKDLSTDIFSLSFFSTVIIGLNSAEDAVNLLEKRSNIYSDRVLSPMLVDPSLFDMGRMSSMLPYNNRWRKNRRLMRPWLHQQAVKAFDDSQQKEAWRLLHRLAQSAGGSECSEELYAEFPLALGKTLARSIYGYRLEGTEDPFLGEMHKVLDRALGDHDTSKSIVASTINHSSELGLSLEETDDYVSNAAFTLYAGGVDTSANVLLVAALALITHPEIQSKAQKEIDEVIGSDRLPVPEDRSQLPYTNRFIQEVMRWCPILPTGVPHTCTQADTYRGYAIPEGAIVMGNIWAMSRDEKYYKDPERFDPDRFLDPSVPPCPAFGFGRRMCPGLHFGQASVFILAASLLATFNFGMATDDDGEPVIPKLECGNLLLL